ncbi:MAG: YhjD/YihY/BrkB family envelope integrity protein [Opitutales bacterium]
MKFKAALLSARRGLRRLPLFLTRDIWRPDWIKQGGPRARLIATLRVFTLVGQGFQENRIFTRAAALSFSSLIGLGPLLAIAILISGFVLDTSDDAMIAQRINQVIGFVAPQASQFGRQGQGAAGQSGQAPDGAVELPPQVRDVIDNLIASTRSGAVGVAGVLLLLMIALQLITSIENTFNEIWGVKRGRPWTQKVVIYWTLISFGAVLGLLALTVNAVATFGRFFEQLPFIGPDLFQLFIALVPATTYLVITLLLAAFYRFMPNTSVNFLPALAGGGLVAVLLFLNNELSFLYIQRVITTESLYGSVGIIPILMLGLYVFWIFMLLGGQVTYAVQNVRYLTHQGVWNDISHRTKERIALAALMIIARRFSACRPGPTAGEITETLRVPVQILNGCLDRLDSIGWIAPVDDAEDGAAVEIIRFQPARPLDRMTLGKFKQAFDGFGNNEGADLLENDDPVLRIYAERFCGEALDDAEELNLEALVEHYPEGPVPAD